MATKRQKVQVGIFLAAAFALLAIVLLVLAGFRRAELVTYRMQFQENISGLTEGSKVTYSGVPVGKITNLVVTPDNRVGITIGVDPRKVTLREGVTAKYSAETLFGPFVIDLFGGGDKTSPPLEPGSTIPVRESIMPLIERSVPETLTRVNNLVEVLVRLLVKVNPEDVPVIVGQIKDILENADKAVTELGKQVKETSDALNAAIRSVQAETEKTSRVAAAALAKVDKASDDATRLFQTLQATIEENRAALASSLKRLDEALAKADTQLKGLDVAAAQKSLREALDKVAAAADSVAATAKTVGESANAIASAANTTSTTSREIRRSATDIERSLTRSLEELDRAVRSARSLFDTLERDPSALFRGKQQEPEP